METWDHESSYDAIAIVQARDNGGFIRAGVMGMESSWQIKKHLENKVSQVKGHL